VPRPRAPDEAASPTGRPARNTPPAVAAAAARLGRDPRFRQALCDYCHGMAAPAPIPWPVYKMFDQLGRYLVSYMLIHNYYRWRHAGGPAPTMSALQAVAGSSARRTAGFVAALKLGRFVAVEADPADRRVKLLRPEPAMVAEIGRSMRLFVAVADAVAGRRPGRAARLADPDRLGEVVRRSAAAVLADGTLLHGFPRVLHFTLRDCGYPLLCAVVGAHYALAVPGAPPAVPLGRRALAARFQVSPAHIGNLVGEAERQGWFAVGRGGRLAFLSGDLLAEFERWAAGQTAHFDAVAGAALAAPPRRGPDAPA